MQSKSEQYITNLLTKKEILDSNIGFRPVTNPIYNLGKYLEEYVPEPNPYEGKYVFIR